MSIPHAFAVPQIQSIETESNDRNVDIEILPTVQPSQNEIKCILCRKLQNRDLQAIAFLRTHVLAVTTVTSVAFIYL
jgi:hypothetical protein